MRLLLALLLFAFPFQAYAAPLPHDGRLRLFHSHSGETLEVRYEENGALIPSALKKIDHFLRSREDGAVIEMDRDLIRLVDHVQDHFNADTVEIICGYRSPGFNAKLKNDGRNVATESQHMTGTAMDIHLDEIDEKALQAYVRKLNLGGVGYYPDLNMVHVDLGKPRFWQEGRFTSRLNIGLFNKKSPIRLTTDRLFYLPGQVLKFKSSVVLKGTEEIQVDWFRRGEWKTIGKIPALPGYVLDYGEGESAVYRESGRKLTVPYGKLRLRLAGPEEMWQNSNEFYLKRP